VAGDSNPGGETGSGGASSSDGGKNSGGANTSDGGSSSGGETSSGGAPPCGDNSDSDCKCVDGSLIAKDVDGDGAGTKLCEASPGEDCDDGDTDFISNECGGCIKDLGGAVGDACGECGVLKCQGDSALVCRSPSPQPKRCTDLNSRQFCVDGTWVVQPDCGDTTPVCLSGGCVQCNPGAPINTLPGLSARQYKCDTASYDPDDVVYRCSDGGYWESTWILSCYASSAVACDAATGTCKTTGIQHLRDKNFEVVPALLRDLPARESGRPVLDVFDSLLGAHFG
jgi:hypothetical protein